MIQQGDDTFENAAVPDIGGLAPADLDKLSTGFLFQTLKLPMPAGSAGAHSWRHARSAVLVLAPAHAWVFHNNPSTASHRH